MAKKFFVVIFILIFNTIHIFGNSQEKKIAIKNIKKGEFLEYRAFVLGDEKGNVFYSENIKEKFPLASITKIMTLILTFDALQSGKIKITDKVRINKEMMRIGGSKIWLKEGTEITVDDLIKATAIHSANNAAYGLAKFIGGNVDNFVKMMNIKAKKLGFGDEIEYHTPTGLPPDMTGKKMDIGSALGVYKLSLAALKYKEYIKIASKKEEKLIYLENKKIKNRNKLLGKKGIYGIKTGHLDNWYNISIASRNKLNSICVVLGAPTENIRDEKIIFEITRFNKFYKNIKLLDKNIPVSEIKLYPNSIMKTEIYSSKNFNYTIKNSDKIKFYIYRQKNKKILRRKRKIVGRYELKINNRIINTGDLLIK